VSVRFSESVKLVHAAKQVHGKPAQDVERVQKERVFSWPWEATHIDEISVEGVGESV
jgi:hypothetical protein